MQSEFCFVVQEGRLEKVFRRQSHRLAAGAVTNMVLEMSVSFVTSQRADIFRAIHASAHFPTTVEKTKNANEFVKRLRDAQYCFENTGKLNYHNIGQFNYFSFVYDL